MNINIRGYVMFSKLEHEGRNCAIPRGFKIIPLLRLNFSLRENSKAERSFSALANLLTKRRLRMKGENVNKQLFLRDKFKA